MAIVPLINGGSVQGRSLIHPSTVVSPRKCSGKASWLLKCRSLLLPVVGADDSGDPALVKVTINAVASVTILLIFAHVIPHQSGVAGSLRSWKI